MKKTIIIGLTFLFFSNVLGQKKELKNIEKLIKTKSFELAFTELGKVKDLVYSSDNKIKSKYHYLRGLLFFNDTLTDRFESLKSAVFELNKVKDFGQTDSFNKSETLLQNIFNDFIEKYNKFYQSKDYKNSYKNIEAAYRVYNKDTLYLYNAAIIANQAKMYDEALIHYIELNEMGYKGISTRYFAINKENGLEEEFPDEKQRELFMKSGMYEKPRDELGKSEEIFILRQISSILRMQERYDEALSYLDEALIVKNKEINVLLDKATIYVDLEKWEEYQNIVELVLTIEPDNYELLCNLAIVNKESGNTEEALNYINRALSLDDTNTRGLIIAGEILLKPADDILVEMNSLGYSRKEELKYDELKKQREVVIRKSIAYFEKAFNIDKSNEFLISTLSRLYSVIGDEEKFEYYKSFEK